MKPLCISRKTLARLLDTTEGALAMRAMRGQQPTPIRISARKVVYDLREVEEFLHSRKVKTVDER